MNSKQSPELMGSDRSAWPSQVEDLAYSSSADHTLQPALAFTAKTDEQRPLLVALHTWSGDYTQAGGETVYADWCIQNSWHFIHPNFRGPNWTPQALGSDFVVEDISSAVEHMKKICKVDPDRIYLVGVSGGGHASLLMAGRRPEIWAGVSAWCGISSIKEWYEQTKAAKRDYYEHIETACGGNPSVNPEAARACELRSPAFCLKNARGVNLDINAGVEDGRTGSVPFSQSLYAFNEVVPASDRIAPATIESFYEKPDAFAQEIDDPVYGAHTPLFRKTSGNARVTVFKGGHEIVQMAALNWLARQRKSQPATWAIPDPVFLGSAGNTEAGK
ncbi:MAG: hypothetical protein A2X49_03160 [Lentisphaerae bacterium GWF2_52_8]|nr:MAG: hypothetical protein A2X49_03160 [Lentisphaerae bacterium GWF2_52_8]